MQLKEYEKTYDMEILNVRDGVYQPLMHNSSFELFLHMRNYLDGENINNLVFMRMELESSKFRSSQAYSDLKRSSRLKLIPQ
jgi:hypothetical protein